MMTASNLPAQEPPVKAARQPTGYGELFWLFAKIGLFTVGGGAVMLPLIQDAVVQRKKWLSAEAFADAVAICNSAPGAFTINAAIYIGYGERGLCGATAAMLGMVTPSVVIIVFLAYLILLGANINILQQFFAGVRPIVAALLLDAGLKLRKIMLKSPFDLALLALGLLMLLLASLNTVFVILTGVIISIIYRRAQAARTHSPGDSGGSAA